MAKDYSELGEFVKSAVKAGESYEKIEKVLNEAGWQKEQIDNVLKFYYKTKFSVAVPKPKIIASPRLSALNLFYFLAFYATLCSLTFAIFTVLDYYLPDGYGEMRGAFRTSNLNESLQLYLSTIIVSAPVTIYTGSLIRKAIRNSGQSSPMIRLRLIYLSFLIGAIILLICGVCFVNYLIDGILSWRFAIKVALMTAKFGSIYLYFKPELYKNEAQQ